MSLVFWWNILPTIQVTLWSNQEWSGKPAFCFWNPRFFLSITIITLQYVLSLIVTYELLSLLKFTHLRWFTKTVTSTKKSYFHFSNSLVTFDFRWAYGMSPMPCRSQAEMKGYLLMLVRWSTGSWVHRISKNTYKGRGQIIKMNFSRICIKQGSYTSLITIFISFKLLIIALIF